MVALQNLFFPPVPPFIPGYRLIDGEQLNKLASHIPPTMIYASRFTTLAEADGIAASSPYGVLVIDLPILLSSNTTLSAPYVMFTGAGQLTRAANTVTIKGQLIAPETSILFDAAGTGLVQLQTNTDVSVYWLGATGLGLIDDTNPIIQAIACLKSSQSFRNSRVGVIARATLFSRYGSFLITSQVTFNLTYATWDADGSTIQFAPTSNSVCIALDNGAAQSIHVHFKHFILYSKDTTFIKIGFQLNDMSNCLIEDIFIWGNALSSVYWSGGATGSIGIRTRGRELTTFEGLEIYADTAINVANNPNTVPSALEDCDHFKFVDCYLIGTGAGVLGYISYVNDGLGVSNLEFEGYQAWVGGAGGFYMNDTRVSGIASRCIKFSNVRGEQCVDATKWWFNINATTMEIDNVEYDNVLCDSSANSFRYRGVMHSRFDSVVTATAHAALDLAKFSVKDTAEFSNCLFDPSGTFTLTGFVPSSVSAWDHIDFAGMPTSATYVAAPGVDLDIRYSGSEQNNVRKLSWALSLAAGVTQVLATSFTGSQAATAAVIRAVGAGVGVLEGGTVLYSSTPATVVTGGTANFAAADTAGKLCVFISGTNLVVKNNTAVTLKTIVVVDGTVI